MGRLQSKHATAISYYKAEPGTHNDESLGLQCYIKGRSSPRHGDPSQVDMTGRYLLLREKMTVNITTGSLSVSPTVGCTWEENEMGGNRKRTNITFKQIGGA